MGRVSLAAMEMSRKLLYDPVISYSLVFTKDPKLARHRNTYTSTFAAALFTTAKLWSQFQWPTTEN